ncbi:MULTISPECIES: response regulator [Ramlibacter]|uniref:Response regulator n=1 Tax=Ramlibacter aquaticus TaxID=2780094 RepID=A0ABR9SI87_9BURK|nr:MULTISPECIES: response regulator [Ramlibacter]MBE7942066.1 response regulator [Ramlibacter aquaticus]
MTLARGSIFVLDGDTLARQHAESCLLHLGWCVKAFGDGADLVQALPLHRPEAALVDVSSPQLSGHWVAARIRRALASRRMRVVAYTALHAVDRDALIAQGFDGVLPKPAQPRDFARMFVFGARSSH